MLKNKLLYLFVLLSTNIAFCQEETKYETASKHNSKIKEHALKIKYGESRTHKEHVNNSDAIGKHLDSAVIVHDNVKKKIPKRYRDDVQRNSAAIEKQHAEAKKHHQAMKNELNKDKHNEMIVRHHANKIHASVEKVEKEEEIIKAKTDKQ